MSIDLAKPRVFALEERKRKFTYTCTIITTAMWLKYFPGIVSTQELVDGNVESSYDASGARLDLLQSALVAASGWNFGEGCEGAMPEGWQSKLPISHRMAVAEMLTSVERVPLSDDELPMLGVEIVALKATWTANEQGRMQAVTGLRHYFNSPTADHQKRYSRAMSRSVIVGGSRTGQTRYLGAQDVLIEIYDELIVRVDGYTFNDKPVVDEVDGIRVSMDAYHKVAAATALFAPLDTAAE